VTGGTPREVSLPGYPIMIATAPDHVCALVKDKGVYCWGSNDAGQLGVAIPDPDPAMVLKAPQKSGLPSIATGLSAGSGFTCAIVNGSVKCMGGNIQGTLGNLDFSRSVEPIAVPGLTTITQIGSGFAHTCALDTTGDTYCWGANDNGQCGQDKDEQTIDHALQVPIPKATRLMIGWETSCALTSDGTYCWGRNNNGQFGDMDGNDGLPRKVALDGYLDIKPGASRVFGLRQDGTVDYWGLELTKMGQPVAPTGIHGVNNLSAISGGSNHGCGITGGQVFCWGDNTCHQLGGAPGDISAVPVRIL
jgi:alpha-tubulin suppressor-like RCC1 family protein